MNSLNSTIEKDLNTGFAALASKTADRLAAKALGNSHQCEVVIQAHYQAKQVDRLDWASQYCLKNGYSPVRASIGLVWVELLKGQSEAAIELLKALSTRYKNSGEIPLMLGHLYQKADKYDDAAAAYALAAPLLPGQYEILKDALEYLMQRAKWKEAAIIITAMHISESQPNNPWLFAKAALVYKRSNQMLAAERLLSQVRELLKGDATTLKHIQTLMPDLGL